jgi:hypothetical protein
MTDRPRERWKWKGVRKDPFDLRDWRYEPSLRELPFSIDNRRKVPIVRDQVQEGACTGFALMAVVNYLIHNRSDRPPMKDPRRESVSPRMLYEMAKRYDEWEGEEEYEGSSIRGAMKGWHKHGVCTEPEWPYVEGQKEPRLTPRRQLAALHQPLGAYFRVRHLQLNHMHSALNEVGILYASAAVHEGWGDVDRTTGKIPFRRDLAGKHAFAIVGYDKEGFWIQNSWGSGWGLGGFGHISYDDWLENGYDCWVARLGVPIPYLPVDQRLVSARAGFDYVPHEAVVRAGIQPHFVNLGNDGKFSTSGRYKSDTRDARRIIHEGFKKRGDDWGGTPKLLLYAHGGLNDEKASATRIYSMLPYFLANQIYPLHFMWETGFLETIRHLAQDAFRQARFQGWIDSMRDKFHDLLDEAIELATRRLGQPIWREIKENAERASGGKGGATVVARQIADYCSEPRAVELHLVGHSAGSVFHAHLIPRLIELGLPIKTLTFYAPACTIELFKSNILDYLGTQIERLTIFNLTKRYEEDDSATSLYHKSLLYLVSGAFEEQRNKPLLGMDTFIRDDRDLRKELGEPVKVGESTVIYSVGVPSDISLASASTTHGGFDNDDATLNSTLRIIRKTNQLVKEFEPSPR